jgi:predicted DCC family thiol-disulfide oxidoreductase YuxK
MTIAYPLTVYYDATCPLCRAEIETLKARDAHDVLRLVDCSQQDFHGADGITADAMMSRIHARDATGRWLRGMDVFAAIYAVAGLRFLARLYASATLRPLFDRLYPWIADHRQLLSRCGLPKLFRIIAPQRACTSCMSPMQR